MIYIQGMFFNQKIIFHIFFFFPNIGKYSVIFEKQFVGQQYLLALSTWLKTSIVQEQYLQYVDLRNQVLCFILMYFNKYKALFTLRLKHFVFDFNCKLVHSFFENQYNYIYLQLKTLEIEERNDTFLSIDNFILKSDVRICLVLW